MEIMIKNLILNIVSMEDNLLFERGKIYNENNY